MSHERHGWPRTSLDEENNNRYQSGAPLVAYCGRCKALLPADESWAQLAAAGDKEVERILFIKINRWKGRHVLVQAVGRDVRGRLELEYTEQP